MTKDREPIEGEWRGEAKWSCPFCAFDSLQRDRVTFHIEQVHPLPPPPKEKPTKGAKS
jgi:hypothetical protein